MRQEPKNEIDLLLRQLAARDGVPPLEVNEEHLDADELNSYVADALPPAARTRYTAHLADCASCRKIVAQLSALQGAVVAQQSGTVAAPSGFKQLLASLFSPMVLRYAVPALGVIVIMIVGIVVLRRDLNGDFLASRRGASQPEQTVTLAPAAAPTQAPGLVDNSKVENSKADSPSRSQASGSGTEAPVAIKPSEGGAAAGTSDSVAVNAKNEPISTPAAQQPIANEAAPAPPPKPAVAEDEAQRRTEREKKTAEVAEYSSASDSAKQRAEPKKDTKEEARRGEVAIAPQVGSAAPTPHRALQSTAADRRDATGARARVESGRDDSKARTAETTAETRSVAGRRFRKQGSAWVDTAYESSRPTINVARGSEHYRGLIGDEPELRRIAEELDGEVIVVWKGRAYRIR